MLNFRKINERGKGEGDRKEMSSTKKEIERDIKGTGQTNRQEIKI